MASDDQLTHQCVPSPCVRRCTLDDADLCVGCHRSLDEIRQWGGMDSARRLAVLNEAERRRERAGRRGREPGVRPPA